MATRIRYGIFGTLRCCHPRADAALRRIGCHAAAFPGPRMARVGALCAGAGADLAAVLDEPPFPQPAEPKTPRGASVEFDGVGFHYDAGTAGGACARQVLNDVTFRLPERSMTALVGPSGAGKTTVAALIARFRDATEGTVRIGGVDVREIAADDLAAHVSLVFQDVYLFDGTIEENVRIAAPDAGPAELAKAAALSGLDQENEALFAEAVRTLAGRKTLLVIAHRLSTVVHADRILVLEDGEITERGTHDDLITAGGTYASFWQRRSRAQGWRLEAARP